LKPPKFDGRTSFESFWTQFQNCARHNQWSRTQQLAYLKNALAKDATNVLWDYGTEVTESLSKLTRTLKMRFGSENFAEKNRIELRNRRRQSGETLTDLHIDIRQLSALAYPDTDHKTRELISCDYFTDALADPELGLKIRERQPKNLDAALHIALQLEVWTTDSERMSQALSKLIADTKKLREITHQGNQSDTEGENSQSDSHSDDDDQCRLIAEQAKLLESFQKTLESMEAMKVHVHTDTPRPSYSGGKSQQRTRVPITCYNCGQSGHIARNCPVQGDAIKEVENGSSMEGAAADVALQVAVSPNRTAVNVNNRNVDQSGGGQMLQSPQINLPIEHVRSIKDKQAKTCIRVRYRAYKILALLDTGSDITIADRDVVDRCGWKLERRDVDPIRVANDEEIVVDGIATVELKVNGTSTTLDVFVTSDISGLILGIDWMTRQGPFAFDFLNDRVRFGSKWLQLLKEEKSHKVRRCYVDHDTVLRPTGQTEVDVQITRKGIDEPRFEGILEPETITSLQRVYAGIFRFRYQGPSS